MCIRDPVPTISFNKMNLIIGDIILINNKKYDVLNCRRDIDSHNPEFNPGTGEHLRYDLHKHESKYLSPSHILKIYKNESDIGWLMNANNTRNRLVVSRQDIKKIS